MERRIKKDVIKIIIFIAIANLPFLTIANQIGVDVFLDSFDHPESYHYYKDISFPIDSSIQSDGYVLLQKSSHPDFTLEKDDIVIYYDVDEGICCHRIHHKSPSLPVVKYYMEDESASLAMTSAYDHDIIGKVVGVIDDNIWNSISMETWKTSITSLNIRALLAED